MMQQADFTYDSPNGARAALSSDAARSKFAVSIYSDQPALRAAISDDVEALGLRMAQCQACDVLLANTAPTLGDLVLVDCPAVDGAMLAALATLDERAAEAGAKVLALTSLDALDDVFGVLDSADVQILVAPSHAERLVALGSIVTHFPGSRLRELNEDDRLALLRLTEQVGQVAKQVEMLSGKMEQGESAFRFEAKKSDFKGQTSDGTGGLIRKPRAPLPDPRLVRRMIEQRQLRGKFFDADLFADPAWDVLLDLTAARAEHKRVSITSLCIAAAVPPTTALRWITQMTESGLLERVEDDTDKRRAFIALSDRAADAMAAYFAEAKIAAG